MALRVRESFEAIIVKYRSEAKVQAKAGSGAKGGEDVREGREIGIKKYGENNSVKDVSKNSE